MEIWILLRGQVRGWRLEWGGFTMNRINPRKLLHSKWTATIPQQRQKHFMVTEVEFDDEGVVTRCLLEAVLTRRATEIDWQYLKNPQHWKMGWA